MSTCCCTGSCRITGKCGGNVIQTYNHIHPALPDYLLLKECPFCGAEAEGPFTSVYSTGMYPPSWVQCKNPDCGARLELSAAPIRVIEAWNNRT